MEYRHRSHGKSRSSSFSRNEGYGRSWSHSRNRDSGYGVPGGQLFASHGGVVKDPREEMEEMLKKWQEDGQPPATDAKLHRAIRWKDSTLIAEAHQRSSLAGRSLYSSELSFFQGQFNAMIAKDKYRISELRIRALENWMSDEET